MIGKIYTRKGDAGETGLSGGTRVAKDDQRVETYGTLDELQAQLGLSRAFTGVTDFAGLIFTVQEDLAVACAQISTLPEDFPRLRRQLGASDLTRLEQMIDGLVAEYGLPGGFVVPGRAPDSATMHVARTVCRRAERTLVGLQREHPVYGEVCAYLNRLSDLLFALAWAMEVRGVAQAMAIELMEARI